jgi:hypothetical protein
MRYVTHPPFNTPMMTMMLLCLIQVVLSEGGIYMYLDKTDTLDGSYALR